MYSLTILYLFIKAIGFILRIVTLLLAIAWFTLTERVLLGWLQRRVGPNLVGFFGILQALADGLKLFLKESITPKSANIIIFDIAPITTFTLALLGWTVIPGAVSAVIANFKLSLLFIFFISSLSVHTIIMAGWSSNSRYAFLGGLRSAAQMISYEIALGSLVLTLLVIANSLNFNLIVISQEYVLFALPIIPVLVLFFICSLAETNRHPFDLPEAEAELVSGYNVEYAAMGFALFFLAEYGNIILMSTIIAILFLGGWLTLPFIPQPISIAFKTIIFIILFVLVRGVLPRYRYDQLMRLGWKVYLPFGLAFFIIFSCIIFGLNIIIQPIY